MTLTVATGRLELFQNHPGAVRKSYCPQKKKHNIISTSFPSFQKIAKTYNRGDSPVVTHLTTSPPVRCLNRAERTGSLVVSCSAASKAAK
jgi:hypothetical protein